MGLSLQVMTVTLFQVSASQLARAQYVYLECGDEAGQTGRETWRKPWLFLKRECGQWLYVCDPRSDVWVRIADLGFWTSYLSLCALLFLSVKWELTVPASWIIVNIKIKQKGKTLVYSKWWLNVSCCYYHVLHNGHSHFSPHFMIEPRWQTQEGTCTQLEFFLMVTSFKNWFPRVHFAWNQRLPIHVLHILLGRWVTGALGVCGLQGFLRLSGEQMRMHGCFRVEL